MAGCVPRVFSGKSGGWTIERGWPGHGQTRGGHPRSSIQRAYELRSTTAPSQPPSVAPLLLTVFQLLPFVSFLLLTVYTCEVLS